MIYQNLGAMANATFGYLPANFPGAAHVAPASQFVFSQIIHSGFWLAAT